MMMKGEKWWWWWWGKLTLSSYKVENKNLKNNLILINIPMKPKLFKYMSWTNSLPLQCHLKIPCYILLNHKKASFFKSQFHCRKRLMQNQNSTHFKQTSDFGASLSLNGMSAWLNIFKELLSIFHLFWDTKRETESDLPSCDLLKFCNCKSLPEVKSCTQSRFSMWVSKMPVFKPSSAPSWGLLWWKAGSEAEE